MLNTNYLRHSVLLHSTDVILQLQRRDNWLFEFVGLVLHQEPTLDGNRAYSQTTNSNSTNSESNFPKVRTTFYFGDLFAFKVKVTFIPYMFLNERTMYLSHMAYKIISVLFGE